MSQPLATPRAGKGRSFVYVIELRDSCFYVGKTEDLQRRMEEHRQGKGSKWTKRHAFVKCCHYEEVATAHSSGLETKRTANEMLDKGVNCVRGAGLCHDRDYTLADLELLVTTIGQALDLPYDQVRRLIKPELDRASVMSQATPMDVDLEWECIYCARSFQNPALLEEHTAECLRRVYGRECFRCLRRDGHWAKDCKYPCDVYGEVIEDICECLTCGQEFEKEEVCVRHSERCNGGKRRASIQNVLQGNADGCLRCGRNSHLAKDCFASTHIDGRRLRGDADEGFATTDPGCRASRRTAPSHGIANGCFRCGRASHWANDCYAKTHIDGRQIN